MPTLDTVVINDGQGTPVAHDFDPVILQGGKAKWADRAPAVPAGFLTISREIQEPSGQRAAYKISDGFYLPVVEEVDGSDTVVRYNSTKVEFNVNPNSTLQERKDQYAYLQNWLANADVKDSFLNLTPFF
jgi:hypothetical protein